MTKRIFNQNPPSHEFMSVVRGGGGPFMECSMCGRNHYALFSPYFEPGELEAFQERHANDPDAYIEVQAECVHYGIVQNSIVPDDCPCNGLRSYEDFMWSERDMWASYLMARKLAAQQEADSIFVPKI